MFPPDLRSLERKKKKKTSRNKRVSNGGTWRTLVPFARPFCRKSVRKTGAVWRAAVVASVLSRPGGQTGGPALRPREAGPDANGFQQPWTEPRDNRHLRARPPPTRECASGRKRCALLRARLLANFNPTQMLTYGASEFHAVAFAAGRPLTPSVPHHTLPSDPLCNKRKRRTAGRNKGCPRGC